MGREEFAVEPLIHAVRTRRVLLDTDLARLYGVSTKRFNQAVKRNRSRFPADFAFRLSAAEFFALRSEAPASAKQAIDSERKLGSWSQFVTSSARHRGHLYVPWAFTEHGALMAANILRSTRAIEMSIFVIRAFVRLREEAGANAAILKRLAEIDKTLLEHDSALRDLYRKLLPLLAPPPDPPKRGIGFHTGKD